MSNAPYDGECDWCGREAPLTTTRDDEEGVLGAEYDVCDACLEEQARKERKRLEADDRYECLR